MAVSAIPSPLSGGAGRRLIAILTWGLTFHVLGMALLFGWFGLPTSLVRSIAAWKEIAIVVLAMWAIARAVSGRTPTLVVRSADLFAAGIVALTVVHGVAGLAGAGWTDDLVSLGYGARDLVIGFVAYAVGRTTPGLADDDLVLRRLFLVGAITSAIAVFEWWIVTPEALVLLGVASYFNEFLGAELYTRGNEYGLPTNYWTMIGGRVVQRAGSVHLSSQGFAAPFLLIIPAATTWLTLARRWTSAPFLLLYAVLWTGLLLTITRMTIVACAVQVLFLLVVWRRPSTLLALGAAGTVAAAALLVVVPGLAGYVWETLLWQTSSSASHSKDYYDGLMTMVQWPMGAGLGTTDVTAIRLGRRPLTNDNLMLKYGVELGVLAMLLFGAWLLAVIWTGTRCALAAVSAPRRAFGAFAAAVTIGVVVNGTTATVFNSPMLNYLFFWCAGATLAALDTDPASADA